MIEIVRNITKQRLIFKNLFMKFTFKPEYYWFLIFAFCSIAYAQVQDTIRPNYSGDSEFIQYLLGILPNFFPAIGLPAAFMMILPHLQPFFNQTWTKNNLHFIGIGISIFGLVAWEFQQIITPNGYFDWHDVLWTIVGALCFYGIWQITPLRLKS